MRKLGYLINALRGPGAHGLLLWIVPLSAELSLGNFTYVPAVTATYSTWKSPLSTPATS
ncbi:MAG TPA: hypothetical protein VNV37_02615 [Solirubrobacteraceae bacterium]|nr:hypothetical protein [Solirubrobacteraceae bacterium]